jgi:C-terminal processing protease CtpA/Prc
VGTQYFMKAGFIRFGRLILAVAFLSLSSSLTAEEAPAAGASDLKDALEVIDILKTKFVDQEQLDDKLLNEASVDGILNRLGAGVVIVDPSKAEADATADRKPVALARTEVINPQIGYVRVSNVVAETPAALDVELKKFASAKVQGFILDLRFANGNDYDAACAVAGRFLSDGHKLFAIKRAGGALDVFQAKRSDDETVREKWQEQPLMILVNAQTRGSAEVVAGALRAQNRGILIGHTTAGSAADWNEIPLHDGRILHVATAKIKLPKAEDPEELSVDVFAQGISPDIKVSIDPKVEREAVLDLSPDTSLTASLTPSEMKKGMSEADLVKAHRGEMIGPKAQSGDADREKTTGEREVRDVVLQRAVDVLKGIRVLMSWR